MSEATLEKTALVDGFEAPVECIEIKAARKTRRGGIKPHYHDYIEILFGTAGEVASWISGSQVSLREGELLVINSATPHDFMPISDGCEYICIKFMPQTVYFTDHPEFDMRYIFPFVGNNSEPFRHYCRELLEPTCVPDAFRRAMAEWKERKFGFQLALRMEITGIFLWIIRDIQSRDPSVFERVSGTASPETVQIVKESTRYIKSNYSTVTESDAAQEAGFSTGYYSRIFKNVEGVNFKEYLSNVKVSEAEKLLLYTDDSITSIAYRTGFSTTSHFIECFRKVRHCTPGQYRALWNEHTDNIR